MHTLGRLPRTRRGERQARQELRDHALQRPGRNQPEGIPAIHRQGNEVEVLAHGHGVEYAPKHDASGILTFYMGKNTPERKDFIMGNLVVAVEA